MADDPLDHELLVVMGHDSGQGSVHLHFNMKGFPGRPAPKTQRAKPDSTKNP